MATVNKDFKIKYGLIVEGTTATVNGYSILTKSQADQDYIIGLIGGTATSANTANAVVKRDSNGNFAAGTITANLTGNVTGDVTGTVSSLSNHDTGDLTEGTNLYYTDSRVKDVLTGSEQTNISITEIGGVLHIAAENGVADSTTDDLDEGTTNKYYTDGRARQAISEGTGINYDNTTGIISADLGDFDTDDLTEGASNKYFTTGRIDDHLTGGDGINYSAGTISADLGTGLNISAGKIQVDRNVVDDWYDASGDAAAAQTAAIAAAALDATSKAGQALTDANEYTDAEIITALSTAQGYADTALADANAYTDNAVSGLNWKQAVNLLYDAAIPVLSGSGATQLVVDGHDALGDADTGYRLLLTGVTSPGIYVYESTGGSWTLTRSEDADTYTELIGASVYVMEGTQYGSTSWVQSNHYITDFTGQSWTQFSGQGSVTAGYGIDVNGLEVSVDTAVIATQSDLSTGLGTKQNTLTAGTNIDISNDTVSVTGLTSTDISDFNTAAVSANTGLWDTNGAAALAESNANTYTNTALNDYTTTANLENTIDNYGFAYTSELPTSTADISESPTGPLYYTDARVKDVLTSSTQTNISITEVAGELIITAENGVEDSTTDDLAEGTNNHYFTDERAQDAVGLHVGTGLSYDDTSGAISVNTSSIATVEYVDALTTDDIAEAGNLYFTDSRAVDALEAVVPNFTEIDINSVATQVAATVAVATASTVTAYQFAHADYRSAKFLVKAATSTHTELSEILVTLDSLNNVAITEYAEITSNGNLFNVTADVDGSNVRVRVTTVHNSTDVTVVGTLVA